MMKFDLSAQVEGPDGRMMQSVVVARSIPFARACLVEWKKQDGVERGEWMRRKSFWVPVTVLEAARDALSQAEKAQ
jgi:hypothetical protein